MNVKLKEIIDLYNNNQLDRAKLFRTSNIK